jgi:hypothetical protein
MTFICIFVIIISAKDKTPLFAPEDRALPNIVMQLVHVWEKKKIQPLKEILLWAGELGGKVCRWALLLMKRWAQRFQ